MKLYFVGAGPGDPELITVKGKKHLKEADLIVYAGSLINEEILEGLDAELIDSYGLELQEITQKMIDALKQNKKVVRLHSGDPSLYGAIVEQMEILKKHDIKYEVIPGVSSVFASTAALKTQLTLKGVSESVILTRPSGETLEEDKIKELSQMNTTLVIFLGISKIDEIVQKVDRPKNTPVAVVYKASWDQEKIIRGTLDDISQKVHEEGIERSALIIIGEVVEKTGYRRSELYG
ncbi:precorrin-4 C(11)-methyltransferase [Methanonatronarchaeum sp. AMET6-2]|uniref:precorrin-4 C(11)-methyltransferase n=1 Tax=Methanonatronarchaeum sp. AMET6-2 TaxID=2933293 RepID=UPI001204FE9C|nr:precorrin-4 C(11)-methyltransferase [Methanonatronarchaeum sp. AMET6-2]RZN63420.1 MAG: precorrin-4 C(11)-methyltransferase [Methanonatronarchaeia archaeon]UOY10086.1 precorrin-4 C(11)-methyltransferase [Methanonatronarchaeum sp. AMET6-2]